MVRRLDKIKIIGVIPARYKSSRFSGKPLADICGRPMIWWGYQQCKKVDDFDKVYVATDDQQIYDTFESLGYDNQMIPIAITKKIAIKNNHQLA